MNRIHRNNQPERTTTKQHRQNGWKKVNIKSRFYRIEKRISQKSTPRCGGNKFRNTYNRNLDEIIDEGIEYMDPHTVYHIKGDVIWTLGPKAKHEIMRGQWGRELKDVQLPEVLTLFKKTFLPVRNEFLSRAQFFNMKQEDTETLDEYWKRLVDIERKCYFGSITAEEIIAYKFASTIRDKKARDKFIKGPLKIKLVLEKIEL